MIKKKFTFFLFFFIYGCSEISFLYDNDGFSENLLYQNVIYETYGIDIVSFKKYLNQEFGETTNPVYRLDIEINEETKKRSVQSNQAVTNLDYEISFLYVLTQIKKNCVVFKKDINSRFTYAPKSSGYNFGSEESLQNLYELSIQESLNNFINHLSQVNLDSCNED